MRVFIIQFSALIAEIASALTQLLFADGHTIETVTPVEGEFRVDAQYIESSY